MSTPTAPRAPRWAWIGMAVILLFDVWLRAHTFGPILRERWGLSLWPVTAREGEPLDCDEAAYAYIGHRILAGDVLYRDITENKPPLGYWIYTLTVALAGANELAIRVMPVPMVLATIALVWWIGLRLASPAAGCLAGFLYALMSTDPYVYGNGANLEHAMNLFAVASLAFLVRALEEPMRLWVVGLAGFSLGAAALVKQVEITHLAVYIVALALSLRHHPVAMRARAVALLVAGFAVIWGMAIAVLYLRSAGPSAYDDIVRYGGALATDTPPAPKAPPLWIRWLTGNSDPRNGALPWPFGHTDYLVWWGTGAWPLWLASVPALAWLAFGPSSGSTRKLVAAWTLSAWVQVVLPGLFWAHYYMLPLPGVALAIAVITSDAARRGESRFGSSVSATAGLFLFLGALAWTIVIQTRDYLLVPSPELTARYKGGRQWIVHRLIGREIARRTRNDPSAHLFVWGWQSTLLFYSGLDSVTPHFFADPLLKAYAGRPHPLIQPRIERIMHDLRAHPPELIFLGDPPFPALRDFVMADYLPSHLATGLWVRRSFYTKFEGKAD